MKLLKMVWKKAKRRWKQLWGANLGTFMTYAKSVHLQIVLNLILGFTFNVCALYLDFHKVNVILY